MFKKLSDANIKPLFIKNHSTLIIPNLRLKIGY